MFLIKIFFHMQQVANDCGDSHYFLEACISAKNILADFNYWFLRDFFFAYFLLRSCLKMIV